MSLMQSEMLYTRLCLEGDIAVDVRARKHHHAEEVENV